MFKKVLFFYNCNVIFMTDKQQVYVFKAYAAKS